MTSSKIEMPGEVKADPAALMASLHLLPSPTPNLEIKYTKVSDWRGLAVHGDFLECSPLPLHDLLGSEGRVTGSGAGGQPVIPAQQRGRPALGCGAPEVLLGSWDTSGTHRHPKRGAERSPSTAASPNRICRCLLIGFLGSGPLREDIGTALTPQMGKKGAPPGWPAQLGCLFFSAFRLQGWRPLVPLRSSEARTERSGFRVGIVKTCRSLAAFTGFVETWLLSVVDLMSVLHSSFVGSGNFPGKLGKSFNLCRLTGSLLN